MSEFVRLTLEDSVGVIRLDRPPVNAFNTAMHDQIATVAEQAHRSTDVRAVVIHGGPRAFAAGADIKEIAGMTPADIGRYGRRITEALDVVARIGKPVIAAITGYALGAGCELALAADFRVVAEDALVGLPEIALGVIPGAGGTQRLPRIVGVTRAKEMIFSGEPVKGTRAVEIGLASHAVPAADVLEAAMALARRYATGATAAIELAKGAIDNGLDMDLSSGLRVETAAFARAFATEDQKIGMRSFVSEGPGRATFIGR